MVQVYHSTTTTAMRRLTLSAGKTQPKRAKSHKCLQTTMILAENYMTPCDSGCRFQAISNHAGT